MNKKAEYVVTSETTRVEEGRPDLCWMDIDVDQLEECCQEKDTYYFKCDIHGQQFNFKKEGITLRSAFDNNNVREKRTRGGHAYSFYLDYQNGVIYKSEKVGGKSVIQLDLVEGPQYKSGPLALSKILDKSRIILAELVAKTSVWAPFAYHQACKSSDGKCYAKNPRIRMKRNTEVIESGNTTVPTGDNYPDRQMKEMGRECYKQNFQGYTACHIWRTKRKKSECYTCFANLVLLPSDLASLSNFSPFILDILKYRSYELYGWVPDGKGIPDKPDNYPTYWNPLP